LLAHGRWFSPGTPASSTTKTGRHEIALLFFFHIKIYLNKYYFIFQGNVTMIYELSSITETAAPLSGCSGVVIRNAETYFAQKLSDIFSSIAETCGSTPFEMCCLSKIYHTIHIDYSVAKTELITK
jgi:hypothetical protein